MQAKVVQAEIIRYFQVPTTVFLTFGSFSSSDFVHWQPHLTFPMQYFHGFQDGCPVVYISKNTCHTWLVTSW